MIVIAIQETGEPLEAASRYKLNVSCEQIEYITPIFSSCFFGSKVGDKWRLGRGYTYNNTIFQFRVRMKSFCCVFYSVFVVRVREYVY